eukprot:2329801-Amphidinium_carterae.1
MSWATVSTHFSTRTKSQLGLAIMCNPGPHQKLAGPLLSGLCVASMVSSKYVCCLLNAQR